MLVLVAEVVDLNLIDQRIISTVYKGKAGVAAEVLVTSTETVPAELVGKQGSQRIVIDITAAVTAGMGKTDIRLEALPIS
ncbi:hypothetical protein D3C72_1721210 [compost metagenome]